MRNNNNAIEVTNMNKKFKRVFDKPQSFKEYLVFWKRNKVEYHHVLKDINLDIKKGETVALIGTNGSGKSTLLKLMTKILYPTSGTLETRGKLTSLLELGAGFHPDFTGKENIYFNASVFGLTKKEIDKRVDQIIEFSELGDFIDNPIRTYSSGMYMRLAFSIAINVDAEILLIDEILAVGDQHFQDKCFNKLEELRDSSKTIVIVSHSLETLKTLCNRAVWIYDGNVMLDGKPNEVISKYLERVTMDHQKAIEMKQQSEDYAYHGNIFIDEPSMSQIISKSSGPVSINGWVMCEDAQAILKIFIDDEELTNISRVDRVDVFQVFGEEYGGMATNKKPGWVTSFSPEKFEDGVHSIKVLLQDHKGNIVTKKSCEIFLK